MSRKKRLFSILLDYCIMSCICVPILWWADGIKYEVVAWILAYVIYANKDFVNGRSIAKRFFGLVVVDSQNGERASRIKCFVRNMTLIIWPIEIVMLIFRPSKRLGDYLVATECVSIIKN